MDELTKQRIIEFNRRFGLNTEFIVDESVLGYALNNTIYINSNLKHDYERTNRHELLHFFEDTETFKALKEKVLSGFERDELEDIRRKYELRYYGLYSNEEIQKGVLDNEIVIDFLIDNSEIEYDNGLVIGEWFLGEVEKELENKRYLNLNLSNNIRNTNLSRWEKIFVLNFYDGKRRQLPPKEGRADNIRSDINAYLERLYALDEQEFVIDYNSHEIEREYQSEIKALKQRGEDTNSLEMHKKEALQDLAKRFSEQLYTEYMHIVDFIKGADYEPAFKALMLRETLTKVYKLQQGKEKEETIVKNRNRHESIAGHMVLNQDTLDFIYKNIEDTVNYKNFANLYFAALEVYKKTIAQSNEIKLDKVETYGKGRWIKFDGKKSNPEEYLKNAQKLSALVKDTQWCTKTLASTQLAEGDFFVFVDNDGKPHIAVKTNGNEIDEVRGIQNGKAQELEEGYRDVAISFLENNKEIRHGKEWLEKEEWNKRLVEYRKKIEEGTITKEEIPQLMKDLFNRKKDYKHHGGTNSNIIELRNSLKHISYMLAEYYGCREDEIFYGDLKLKELVQKENQYKVILGNVDRSWTNINSLGNVQVIAGDVDFGCSAIASLGNLRIIGGNACFKESKISSLGNLQTIGGDVDFDDDSKISSLGNLQTIGGDVDFSNSMVSSLGKLQTIGKNAYFAFSEVSSLGNLQTIGGNVDFGSSKIASLGNLQTIGGNAIWEDKKNLEAEYNLRRKRLTGQDIGKAGFGTSEDKCNEAQGILKQYIEKPIEGEITLDE